MPASIGLGVVRMAQVGRRGGGPRRLGLALDRRVAVALCVLAVVAVFAGAVGAGSLGARELTVSRAATTEAVGGRGGDGPGTKAASAAIAAQTPEPHTIVVHVDGAVASPGVYTLVTGSRVADAVAAAGGATPEAQTTGVNLAAPLSDGQQVIVPAQGQQVPQQSPDGVASADAPTSASALINLNTAGVEELDALPGVGEATARAIVEERESNGPFATVEDLVRVSGIGEKKLAKIVGHACV